MLVLFVCGRLRYDVVPALAWVAALARGVVSSQKAFSDFSNPVIMVLAAGTPLIVWAWPLQ